MARAHARLKIMATIAIASTLVPAHALADPHGSGPHGGGPVGTLVKIWKAVKGETRDIDRDAMRLYEDTPRAGSCEERRARIQAMLPDALRFARLARDIGERNSEAEMKAKRIATFDLGEGRTAYYETAGQRYAEVLIDAERRQAVVVFQGTRLAVGSDVSTDVLSFIGVQTKYYRWASDLVAKVAKQNPGLEVVVTGHSLAGGLALYSVLKNPGVKVYAFNPAGLALLTWTTTRRADRERASAASLVVSTRNADHIEPVTAISFAGRSVVPGHVFVVESDERSPTLLHGASTVVSALERVAAAGAGGDVCEGDLGELVD